MGCLSTGPDVAHHVDLRHHREVRGLSGLHEAAADDARRRIVSFFDAHLKARSPRRVPAPRPITGRCGCGPAGGRTAEVVRPFVVRHDHVTPGDPADDSSATSTRAHPLPRFPSTGVGEARLEAAGCRGGDGVGSRHTWFSRSGVARPLRCGTAPLLAKVCVRSAQAILDTEASIIVALPGMDGRDAGRGARGVRDTLDCAFEIRHVAHRFGDRWPSTE